MINRPDKIYYGGKTYKVEYITQDGSSDDNWGWIDFAKSKIVVYTLGVDEIYIAETLLHEVCHIVADYSGLGSNSEMFVPTNEYLVSMMASGYTQLFLQNINLTKYLSEVFYNGHNEDTRDI